MGDNKGRDWTNAKILGIVVIVILIAANWGTVSTWFQLPTGTPYEPPGVLPGVTTPPPQTGELGKSYTLKYKLVYSNKSGLYNGQDSTIWTIAGTSATGNPVLSTAGTANTNSEGYVEPGELRENEIYYASVKFNTTTNVQDALYGPFVMPEADFGQSQDEAMLASESRLIVLIAPTQSSDMDIMMDHSDGTDVGISSTAPTGISLTGDQYVDSDEVFTAKFKISQDYVAFGNAWTQYADDQGDYEEKTFKGYVKVNINGTTKAIWKGSTGTDTTQFTWSPVGGDADNTNYTTPVPMLETLGKSPDFLTVEFRIDFSSATAGDLFQIITVWVDAQEKTTIEGGAYTQRTAPNSGYIYKIQEEFWVLIKA